MKAMLKKTAFIHFLAGKQPGAPAAISGGNAAGSAVPALWSEAAVAAVCADQGPDDGPSQVFIPMSDTKPFRTGLAAYQAGNCQEPEASMP